MSSGNITQMAPQLTTFTVSSAAATVGAVYTSAGFTFTVLSTIAAQTTLLTTASGFPGNSGTLTKVSGTGDATITFSACTISNAYSDALNTSGFVGQSDYSEYAKIGIVGMPYDISGYRDVVSPVAYESISLGLGIVRMPTYSTAGQFVARLPRANVAHFVMSGALTAADTVNLKINGVAMTQLTAGGTPATDAASLVTLLKAMAPVANAAIDTTDTNNLSFYVYSKDGLDCLLTNFAVVGHTITLTSNTVTTNDKVLGVSMQTQGKEQQLGSLILNYQANDVVNCMGAGRIWVFAEVAVSANDPVYIRLQNGTTTIGGVSYPVVRGALRNDSDSGTCVLVPNWFFFQGCSDTNNGLAVVQAK